jgi:hypothetical protein
MFATRPREQIARVICQHSDWQIESFSRGRKAGMRGDPHGVTGLT